jgi:putative SOS response-associated peptidase YedK
VKRRCVIPVTGYYEWRKNPGQRETTPFLVRRKDGEMLSLAGVWESWVSPDGEVVESFAIVTCDAQGFVRDIHDRMPLALREQDIEPWLDPHARRDPNVPPPDDVETLEAQRVSRLVSSPANDVPECMEPVRDEEPPVKQLDLFGTPRKRGQS